MKVTITRKVKESIIIEGVYYLCYDDGLYLEIKVIEELEECHVLAVQYEGMTSISFDKAQGLSSYLESYLLGNDEVKVIAMDRFYHALGMAMKQLGLTATMHS